MFLASAKDRPNFPPPPQKKIEIQVFITDSAWEMY